MERTDIDWSATTSKGAGRRAGSNTEMLNGMRCSRTAHVPRAAPMCHRRPAGGGFPGSAGFQARMPKGGRIDRAQLQCATGVPPVRISDRCPWPLRCARMTGRWVVAPGQGIALRAVRAPIPAHGQTLRLRANRILAGALARGCHTAEQVAATAGRGRFYTPARAGARQRYPRRGNHAADLL